MTSPPTRTGGGLRHRRSGHHRQRAAVPRPAVTIIELVIVVMIIGLFASVAAPTFVDSLLFHRVESAARRVKADLQQLRSTARLTSRTQTMEFSGAVYSVAGGTLRDLSRPGASSYTVDLSAAPYGLRSVDADFDDAPTISFDAFGTPSSSGQVVLAAGAYQCSVVLDGDTGSISIVRNYPAGRAPQP